MRLIRAMAILFATVQLSAHSAEPERVISGDLNVVEGPRSMVWQDCVGAGRVAEGLRSRWRDQLERCHRELGFKFLRMHGLLQDDLGVYSEDTHGHALYNWQYIDDVYDFLIATGVKPFVEISFMPKSLASGQQTVFWWNANITPPKDYTKWDNLVSALVRHFTDRYGAEEVKTWRFEVWNEANIGIFWQPPAGESAQDAYFQLYEHTAKDVKGVNPAYVVGGPAGAGPVWTKELIDLCASRELPIDFISFHSYGLGGGPSGVDLYGNQALYLNSNIHAVADVAVSQGPVIAQTSKPHLPVYITEWSSSYSSRDPIHDSYFSAPYILEQLRRTESVQSMSYWTFTDVFEENGPVPRPFHGGFGLINYQGVPKPAYWAYKYLSLLGPNEIKSNDGSSFVCTDGKGGAQVLLWDLTTPKDCDTVSNQDRFFKVQQARDKGTVTVNLKGLRPGQYQQSVFRIGYLHNDPYSKYLEMGSPTDLSREDVAALKRISSGAAESQSVVTSNGTFTKTLPLQENSVYLLTLEPTTAGSP